MIDICDYLQNIYNDFQDYVDSNPSLCKLKKLHYDMREVPDYSDINVQQLYLLRYDYAYAFEYKTLFQILFRTYTFTETIKVLSLGCGNMIDYWGLAQSFEFFDECSIDYCGVDLIDWHYKIHNRKQDTVKFEHKRAIELMASLDFLDYDVYVFPKSISEFSPDEFQGICDLFETRNILKNQFHIMVSLRYDEFNKKADENRVQNLVQALCKNGFEVQNDSAVRLKLKDDQKGIRSYDRSFLYPEDAITLIERLNEKCVKYLDHGTNCNEDCCERLTRKPIMRPNKIRFMLITFLRK